MHSLAPAHADERWSDPIKAPQPTPRIKEAHLREARSSRPREYLTEREIEKLMDAASGNLLAYRHGLRASELVALRWDDVDILTGKLHVRRSNNEIAPTAFPESARGSPIG